MWGPWAEGVPLYVRTSADVSLWPLRSGGMTASQ